MRGLHWLTGTANRMQARKDYGMIAVLAASLEIEVPPIQDDWGWRRIDKIITPVREAINAKTGWGMESCADLYKDSTNPCRPALAEAVKEFEMTFDSRDKSWRVVKKGWRPEGAAAPVKP